MCDPLNNHYAHLLMLQSVDALPIFNVQHLSVTE